MATSDTVETPRQGRHRKAETPERVYWACVAGILLWAVLRELGVDPGAEPIRFWPFVAVLAVAAINLVVRNRFSAARRRKGSAPSDRQGGPVGAVFVAVDFITIVAGLRFTGGIASAVWVVSFVVLAGETVLERRREAAITRLAACVAIFLGTIPLPLSRVDWPAFALEMFVRMGLLIAVSSVMRRLRERSENALAEISGLRADLALADQRAVFAREIHDNVGNALAAAVLRLDYAARLRNEGGTNNEPGVVLREEAAHLRQAMAAVRDWTFLNKPWRSLENERSSEAMTRESARFAARIGISVEIVGQELVDSLPEHHRNQVLHIVQEALVNTAKHAEGATVSRITLARGDGYLQIDAVDDGQGNPDSGVVFGIGLTSMRERAEGVGGWCRAERTSSGGVAVHALIPVP